MPNALRPLLIASLVAASASANAAITLTPATHDFGNVAVGQTVGPIRLTLHNELSTGSDPILFSMGPGPGNTGNGRLTSRAVTTCTIGTNLMRGDSCVFDMYLEVTGPGQVSSAIAFGFMGWSPSPMVATFRANGVVVSAPTAPALSATPGNGQASFAITAPSSDGGSPIQSYALSCSPSGGGAPVTTSGATGPLVLTGLTNGTAYDCTATATNGAGMTSPASAAVSVTPVAPPVTPPAANVAAVPTLGAWALGLLGALAAALGGRRLAARRR